MQGASAEATSWGRVERALKKVTEVVDELRRGLKTYAIAINDLSDDKWRLVRPFMVTVEERGPEDYTACAYDADVYGYGDNIPAALDDLKKQLVNQIEFLDEEGKRAQLGPAVQKQLLVLRRVLDKDTT